MSRTVQIQQARKATTATPAVPSFPTGILMDGEEVPAGCLAIMIPAAALEAYSTLPLVVSKGGEGASASACRLDDPDGLLLPRADGTSVPVQIRLSWFTRKQDIPAAPAVDVAALLAKLATMQAALDAK